MVGLLSDRAVTTSYRLSIVTMFPSAAVWPQFGLSSGLITQKVKGGFG